MRIKKFSPDFAEQWDNLVFNGNVGSFLHSRNFLSYHGTRFVDHSLLFFNEEAQLVGVLPAAEDLNDNLTVISHPGATFGGIIHDGALVGESMCEALVEICQYYQHNGYQRFIYKKVPSFYAKRPDSDDSYALFKYGARRFRCDLTAVIDLQHPGPMSSRRKRGRKKAEKARIIINEDLANVPELWSVIEENLREKHGVQPVHSLEEILLLAKLFPRQIRFVSGLVERRVVCGVVLFETSTVCHAQYIASNKKGRAIGGLDALFIHCIKDAQDSGKRFFDFGICNEQGGQLLNESLYRFKREFGAGGQLHEFFELSLEI